MKNLGNVSTPMDEEHDISQDERDDTPGLTDMGRCFPQSQLGACGCANLLRISAQELTRTVVQERLRRTWRCVAGLNEIPVCSVMRQEIQTVSNALTISGTVLIR